MAGISCLYMGMAIGFLPAKGAAVAPPRVHNGPRSPRFGGNGNVVLGRARAQLLAPTANNGGRDDVACDDLQRHPPQLNSIPLPIGRRQGVAVAAGFVAGLVISRIGGADPAVRAAVLEADDDVELLEKVKKDRKRRLERQGVISSSGRETGYVQELVYRLSKVGQAIDRNDLFAAGTILGPDPNADWVQNVNAAFAKLSSSPEEKIEVDTFNTSLVSLISSVASKDAELSKLAFVTSASALEKWVTLTGLVGELKGL